MISTDPARIALVTGGARRIGRAISESLVAQGYAVAIHYQTSASEALELAESLQKRGGRVHLLQADLADPADVDALIPAARAALGPVSLLINNASTFEADEIATMSRESFARHMRINLETPLMLAQAFAAQAPSGSSIVNLLDQRINKLTPRFFSYTLTKTGLATATKTMAQALAPDIRVNGVAPGPTIKNVHQTPEEFAIQLAATPLGLGSPPDEIAKAVLYLAEARSVTGQIITVDGGQHLIWQTADVFGITE